jgi:hypothetical protein
MQITSCPLFSSRRASAVIAFKCPTGVGTVTQIRIAKYYYLGFYRRFLEQREWGSPIATTKGCLSVLFVKSDF